jgi:hypothetical protein
MILTRLFGTWTYRRAFARRARFVAPVDGLLDA